MRKKLLVAGTLLGVLSVILGAFGAHALKDILSEKLLATYETAVRYQFYHAFALILTGILYKEFANKRILLAGNLFMIGIGLFSGSLYLLVATQTMGYEQLRWIGGITPLGGVCMIAGWLTLAFGILKK